MSAFYFFLYNLFVVPLLHIGLFAGAFFYAKMREGRTARKDLWTMLNNHKAAIDSAKLRILFHCTSAGEWLQALPVIEKLKADIPSAFIMVSFFSPSGYMFAKNPPTVDLKFYLPLDSRFAARRLFKMIHPNLWVISKFDVWPNHVDVAHRLHIPVVITSATLSQDSGRDKGLSGLFNRVVYKKITHYFPISEEDKKRFLTLDPDVNKYTVAGDTRYDHVYNRGMRARDAGDVKIFDNSGFFTIIAGSTWPADEKHVLPAFARLLLKYPDIRAIVVPHEIQDKHLVEIEEFFRQQSLHTIRFTEIESAASDNRIVIFNAVGMLARLYKQTDAAFIGGSFGKGTHNVMEPAVFGQPVLFGPNHLNSHEAIELLKVEGAFAVQDEHELFANMERIYTDQALRTGMGERAQNLITDHVGATNIIVETLKKQHGFISEIHSD